MRPISAEPSRGYSHLTSGTSKGSFTPLLQVKKFPDIPSPLKRNPSVPPISRVAPFPPASSRGGILSLRGPERIPRVPVSSQEEALSTGKARGTPASCPIPRVPQMSQSIPGKPVFPALPRLSSRGSLTPRWHVGQPCGKASWESLVGKTRGKDTDPLIHAKGSATLLLQLGRKGHVHDPTRDED